jgi:Lar family restriction alleviation protein
MAKKITIELEIKHCPFCGEQDGLAIVESFSEKGCYEVQCNQCVTIGPRKDSYTAAVEAWNTRC